MERVNITMPIADIPERKREKLWGGRPAARRNRASENQAETLATGEAANLAVRKMLKGAKHFETEFCDGTVF